MDRLPRPAVTAIALALLVAAVLGWRAWRAEASQDTGPGSGTAAPVAGAALPARSTASAAPASAALAAASAASLAAGGSDPLLVPGLRHTLEALIADAGEASDPEALKKRLAQLVGERFPAALATRALALAERYVDYRVALGALSAPRDPSDPRALREAIEARQKVRQQHFQEEEHDALFAQEAELDRYTLARLEIARNTQLSPQERASALRAAESELAPERRAERAAATAHLDAAAQTAAFNAQGVGDVQRHLARSAQYGEQAAHALAQLDRDEQHWQNRLDELGQARARQGEAAAQALRQQLFSAEELQRVDAALALRALQAPGSRP
ncbi:lipase secretion chaperone [Acidovorax sp. CF316]|uniref:lipase secretion chaperone n=1 Tax=Acidovorax sp. CF316 TaxID=1144317 RepID=UPI000D3674B8|nr:lipase secretion chaperone [Acidovorax sp. CF316]